MERHLSPNENYTGSNPVKVTNICPDLSNLESDDGSNIRNGGSNPSPDAKYALLVQRIESIDTNDRIVV